MHDGEASGVLRLDPFGDYETLGVSIYVAPKKHRLGLGLIGLQLLRLCHPTVNINAHVLSNNKASQRMFEAAGYYRLDDNNLICRANV